MHFWTALRRKEFTGVGHLKGGAGTLEVHPDGTIQHLFPLLVNGGEEGLAAFIGLVRAAWAEDRDYVIDLTVLMVPFLKSEVLCTIEFRRGN